MKKIIRVTKEFSFEMAHALRNYDGLCRNIHGHSYRLFVTVKGEPIVDANNSKCGMVIDFGELKKIVKEEVVDPFDHAVVLNQAQEGLSELGVPVLFERNHYVPYQPTCENMIADFATRIKKRLPKEVELFSLKLHETATSFAEWYASDQEEA